MPIDASIYNQVGKPTVELESPQNALMRSTQLQNAQNQNKLFTMQVRDADEARAAKNALATAYQNSIGADGQIDRSKLYSSVASSGQGAQLPGIQKNFTDMDKSKQEAIKAELDTHLKTLDVASRALGPTLQNPALYPQVRAFLASKYPENAATLPEQFDAATIQAVINKAMDVKDQIAIKHKEIDQVLAREKFGEDKRHNRTTEGIAGGHLAVAREGNDIKRQEVTAGGKPPPGYRWTPQGTLAAIPGGPGDKLPEAQQKQVIGTQNLSNAIAEYRKELAAFNGTDALKPDKRASMGTKYNNMLLQAKEAYNLGVLNGPDYDILQSVITDPRSIKGAITSKGALDSQASELDRIMSGIAATSGNKRPQDGAPDVPRGNRQSGKKQPNIDALLDKYK